MVRLNTVFGSRSAKDTIFHFIFHFIHHLFGSNNEINFITRNHVLKSQKWEGNFVKPFYCCLLLSMFVMSMRTWDESQWRDTFSLHYKLMHFRFQNQFYFMTSQFQCLVWTSYLHFKSFVWKNKPTCLNLKFKLETQR